MRLARAALRALFPLYVWLLSTGWCPCGWPRWVPLREKAGRLCQRYDALAWREEWW